MGHILEFDVFGEPIDQQQFLYFEPQPVYLDNEDKNDKKGVKISKNLKWLS